jgi:hypothetical protein
VLNDVSDRDDGDQPRRSPHLSLQRAVTGTVPLRKRRDAADLGVHAGREDERPRFAAQAYRAAEDDVAGVDRGALGLACLNKREAGTEGDGSEDRETQIRSAGELGQAAGAPEQKRKRMHQLAHDVVEPVGTTSPVKLVRPVLSQPPRRIPLG